MCALAVLLLRYASEQSQHGPILLLQRDCVISGCFSDRHADKLMCSRYTDLEVLCKIIETPTKTVKPGQPRWFLPWQLACLHKAQA